MSVANTIDENSAALKIIAAITGASYEPLMSYFSRSIGQRITGLKIIAVEGKQKNIFAMYLRYLVKGLLGWISFLTIHSNPQRRAIHDMAADTVMIKA